MDIHGVPIYGTPPKTIDKLMQVLIPADVEGLKRIHFISGNFGGHNGVYLQAIKTDDWFEIKQVNEPIAADKMPCIVVNTNQEELLTALVFLHEVGHHHHRMANMDEDASEIAACVFAIAKASMAYQVDAVPGNKHWEEATKAMGLI